MWIDLNKRLKNSKVKPFNFTLINFTKSSLICFILFDFYNVESRELISNRDTAVNIGWILTHFIDIHIESQFNILELRKKRTWVIRERCRLFISK